MENISVRQVEEVRTTTLRTDDLKPNEYNPNHMTDEEFAELVEEVRHLGRLPKPIVVRNRYAGEASEYQIVDGEHGWRAAKEVGLGEVACEVIEADDFEAMRQTYKRNQHGTHDRVALGEMFKKMLAERGLSNRELAGAINVSEGTIRNALMFAQAAEMRRAWAGEKGATADDFRFTLMTTKQVRDYVHLPEGLRDRWLDGGAKPISHPETWGMSEQAYVEDLDSYLERLAETGIAKVFDSRGPWDEKAKLSYELITWRENHRRVIGKDIDAYMRPVIEKRPVNPTPIQLLEQLPVHGRKPLLTPEEWARAVEVAWEKGNKVYEVLGRFNDVAKLKAHDLGIPADDLDDPRTALRKLEVEQEAPAFLRAAPLPVHTKHWLLKNADTYYDGRRHISSSSLTPEDRLRAKQIAVRMLVREQERYKAEEAAYRAHMEGLKDLPPERYMEVLTARLRGGGGPPYPRGVPGVADAWVSSIKAMREEDERAEKEAQLAELKETFGDPEKVAEAIAQKLGGAAPKVFGQEVEGKVAWEVLRERLKAVPRPELLLFGAILLRAPVTVWIDALHEEREDSEDSG